MSVTAFSSLLGVIEIAIGVLIAVRPVWPAGSALGSGLAVAMFLTTLSFLVTTPLWEPSLGGFPAVSAMPGQFVLKHIVVLVPRCGRPARHGQRGRFGPAYETPNPMKGVK